HASDAATAKGCLSVICNGYLIKSCRDPQFGCADTLYINSITMVRIQLAQPTSRGEPAIQWMPQEVPHSRPYSDRNRTGDGVGPSDLRSTGGLSPSGNFRFAEP